MANKKVLIWVSALATLAICGLCAIAIALGDSEPTAESSRATATVTATEVTTATEAPQPSPTVTRTPDPPTVTPTEAPLPTSTPSPTATVNVFAVYFLQITPYTLNMGAALGDLSDLMQSSTFDEEWGWGIIEAIVVIRTSHEKLTEISPPIEVSYIHEALLNATKDCNEMTYHLAAAIDQNSEQELARAGELLQSCGDKAKVATELIEGFAGQ